MAEQLVNEFTVNRPIDEAWAVITDVERIAPCLPGAELQEIEGDIYRGIVKVKLGSITPQFKGQATFIDRDDPGHRAVLKAEGRDTGGRGNAAAEITAQAESLSPTSTRCVVTTDLHITGRVAQFGRGILGDVSKKLMAQFASNLNTMLDDQGAETPAAGNGDTAPTPLRHGPTTPTDQPDGGGRQPPATTDLPPAGADQSGPQPRVRKIEGPGHRARRPRRRRRSGDPQAPRPAARRRRPRPVPAPATPLGPGGVAPMPRGHRPWTPTTHASPSCSAAGRPAATTVVVRDRAGGPGGDPQRTRCSTTARRCRPATGSSAATRSRRSAGWRPPAASAPPKRRSTPPSWPPPTPATPPNATPTFPPTPNHRPSGGVGGTRQGVKCLHAHYAWHLAGGDDPVGRWVAAQLAIDRGRRHRRDDHRPLRPAVGRRCRRSTRRAARRARRRRPAVAAVAHQRHRRGHRRHRQPAARASRTSASAAPSSSPATRRGTSPSSSGVRPGRAVDRVVVDRDDLEDLFRTLATERRDDRLHNPALQADRVDSILATCCAVLAFMRRLQFARRRRPIRPASDVRRTPLMRHPSGRPTIPSPLRLYGSRVMLRPLVAQDFAAWREVRQRNEAWLTPWEPRRPLPQFDPTVNREAFVSRCAARERDAAAGLSFGFGLFVDDRVLRRGQRQPRAARRDADRHDRLLGRRALRRARPRRRGRRRRLRVRLRAPVAAPARDQHRAAQRQQPTGHGEARRSARKGSPCACSRSTASWEDHVRYAITAEEWQERADELRQRWLLADPSVRATALGAGGAR